MFADGASDPDKVETFMYGHEYENFAKGMINIFSLIIFFFFDFLIYIYIYY